MRLAFSPHCLLLPSVIHRPSLLPELSAQTFLCRHLCPFCDLSPSTAFNTVAPNAYLHPLSSPTNSPSHPLPTWHVSWELCRRAGSNQTGMPSVPGRHEGCLSHEYSRVSSLPMCWRLCRLAGSAAVRRPARPSFPEVSVGPAVVAVSLPPVPTTISTFSTVLCSSL